MTNLPVLAGTALMAGLQLTYPYLPATNTAFGSVPIGWAEWGLIALMGLAIYAAVGIEKWVQRRGDLSRPRRLEP